MHVVQQAQKHGSSPIRRRVSEDGSFVDLYADVERNRAPPSGRPPRSSLDKVVSSPKRNTELKLRGPNERTRVSKVDLSFSCSELDLLKFSNSFSEGFKPEVSLDLSESSEEEYHPRKLSQSPMNEKSERSQRTTISKSSLKDSPPPRTRGRSYTESQLRDSTGRTRESKSPKRSKSSSSRSQSGSQSQLKSSSGSANATSQPKSKGTADDRADSKDDRSRSKSRSRLRSTSTGRLKSDSPQRSTGNEKSVSPVRYSSIDSTHSGSTYSTNRPPRSTAKKPANTVWSPEMGYKSKTSHSNRSSDRANSRRNSDGHSSRQRSASAGRSSNQREKKKLEEKKQKARAKIASQMTTRTWRAQLADKFGRNSTAIPSGMVKSYRVPSTLVCKNDYAEDIPDDLTAIP